MFDRGARTRLDLKGHAVVHTAPNVKAVEPSPENPARYAPICVGTTTSMRMERFTRPLMEREATRIIVGKGGMGAQSLAAFRDLGGASSEESVPGLSRGCGQLDPPVAVASWPEESVPSQGRSD